MGVLYVLGKIEAGTIYKDSELLLMPNNKKVCPQPASSMLGSRAHSLVWYPFDVQVQCTGLLVEDTEVPMARAGENILMRIKGCEEEEVVCMSTSLDLLCFLMRVLFL